MSLTSTDRARTLQRLHMRIRACTKCVAAGYLERARPVVAGSIRDRIAIVGQAPGAVELTTGQPFAGRSGAELRRWLGEAGIDEAHLPYRTAITKCFPGKAASGAGDRRPSPAEIALCAPWLEQELALVRPRVVLLLGTLAIGRLWGKGPIDALVGSSRRAADVALETTPTLHRSQRSGWYGSGASHAANSRRGLPARARPRASAVGSDAFFESGDARTDPWKGRR